MPFDPHVAVGRSPYLVSPFAQRGIVKGHAAGGAGVGYGMCVGISVDWIIQHKTHKGEDPARRLNSLVFAQGPAGGVDAQLAYNAVPKPGLGKQEEAIEAAFKARNSDIKVAEAAEIEYKNDPVLQKDQLEQLRQLARMHLVEKTKHVHEYYIVILQFGFGRDAHATAAYHSGGKMGFGAHLYYFDPNYGEFKLPANPVAITAFFKDLADAYHQSRNVQLTRFAVYKLKT